MSLFLSSEEPGPPRGYGREVTDRAEGPGYHSTSGFFLGLLRVGGRAQPQLSLEASATNVSLAM